MSSDERISWERYCNSRRGRSFVSTSEATSTSVITIDRRDPSLQTEVRTVRMVRSSITEVIARLVGPGSAPNRDSKV